MTGQGETVQLLNHVGATGFRGLKEGLGQPSLPTQCTHMSSRSSAHRSQLNPWAEGEEQCIWGGDILISASSLAASAASALCRLPMSLLPPGGLLPSKQRESFFFPLADSFFSFSSGWRRAAHPSSYTSERTCRPESRLQRGPVELAVTTCVFPVLPVPHGRPQPHVAVGTASVAGVIQEVKFEFELKLNLKLIQNNIECKL